MKWKTKDGRLMEINDMTDSHIRNAWAYLFRNLGFGVTDGQMSAFDGFKETLKRRGMWNLKLELQYRDLETRNKAHHIAEDMMDYDMHGYEYH